VPFLALGAAAANLSARLAAAWLCLAGLQRQELTWRHPLLQAAPPCSGASALHANGLYLRSALSLLVVCCSFETALAAFGLDADPALEEIGRIVHEADLADERYDAPAAAGLDVLIRGLTLTSGSDHDTLTVTGLLFDGLYEHTRRQLMTGRPSA
jgi:hypothetical protein